MQVRGVGMMAGVELAGDRRRRGGEKVMAVVKGMLRRGYITLPEGARGEVLALSPPLVIGRRRLGEALDALEEEISRVLKV